MLGLLSFVVHSADIHVIRVDDGNTGALVSAALMTLTNWNKAIVIEGNVDSVIAMMSSSNLIKTPHADFENIRTILVKERGAIQFSVDSIFDNQPVKIDFTLRMVFDRAIQRIDISDLTIAKLEDSKATLVPFLALQPNVKEHTLEKITLVGCLDRSILIYPLFDAYNPAASYDFDETSNFINVFNLAKAAYRKINS